ncbi:MAG: hypothetical protein JWN14_3496, partial [Chthonomonadales bacterium]|nr:hypothetical protein [Chthonomonadales bacterium]
MQRSRSVIRTFCIAISLVGFAGVGGAQQNSPPIPLHLEYDVAKEGPLLVVLAGDWSFPDIAQLPREQQLEACAVRLDAHAKRIRVGSLTVLAPKTMRIIETKPDSPNPFADLKPEERLQVLLSFFDAAQWAQAGSVQGIGLADMNEKERPLFLSLLPEQKTGIQRTRLVAGAEPGSRRYEPLGAPQEADPPDIRLRLVRKIRYWLSKENTNDFGYTGAPEPEVGEEIGQFTSGALPRGDRNSNFDTTFAFGVPIVRTVPNRLKPSDLDFADPKLRVPVVLDENVKTLGDLLKRVAQATGLDLRADRRVAGAPLLVRMLPVQQMRAGDVLQALCWSVTGALRRIGTSTYLLTDDVVGIGVRVARLEEWADEAFTARYKAIDNVSNDAFQYDPLSHIGFAPGDPNSLSPEQMRQGDNVYRKSREHESPEYKLTNLPPSLQKSIREMVAAFAKDGDNLQTGHVRVDTQLSMQYVLPGGAAATPGFCEDMGLPYLQLIAAPPIRPASGKAGAKPVSPKPMSEALPKRVLVARLPAEAQATAELLNMAKSKGFTEVWLHVHLDETQITERLSAAQVRGRKLGLAIGAAVSLLKNGGTPGEEDVNIFGETGAVFAKRRIAASPQSRYLLAPLADWLKFSPDQVTRLLTPLAQVPGLSALTLKGSAAPGWAGDTPGGDGLAAHGHLGYDLATRLACLREEGFDPIDVYNTGLLEMGDGLRFFPNPRPADLWKALCNFRLKQNQKGLAQDQAALRKVAPQLPLYLDDRSSPFTSVTVRWFGRWDDPARIAINPIFFDAGVAREAAFASSREPLLRCDPWNG